MIRRNLEAPLGRSAGWQPNHSEIRPSANFLLMSQRFTYFVLAVALLATLAVFEAYLTEI
jgi:hypothetical protein